MTNEKGQDGEDPHHLTIKEVVWTGMLYCTVLYCSVLYCTVQAGGWHSTQCKQSRAQYRTVRLTTPQGAVNLNYKSRNVSDPGLA